MGFGEAISACFRKYADFTGRAARSEYWYWTLFRVLLIGGISILAIVARVNMLLALLGLEWLGMLLPSLAVAVRRLHDVNCSGWLLLIVVIPFGGLLLFVLACVPGTQGGNKYGPGPWGERIAEVF
jgi:uncharacterized membrane protein YhaH (DUF805 family)